MSMRIVMPAVLPSSDSQPFRAMGRFETGDSGSPHLHGFTVASGGPRLGRVRGDVDLDAQSDEAPWSDDDGADGEAVADQVRVFSDGDASGDDGSAAMLGAEHVQDPDTGSAPPPLADVVPREFRCHMCDWRGPKPSTTQCPKCNGGCDGCPFSFDVVAVACGFAW